MIITPTLIAAVAKIAYDTYGPQVKAWINDILVSSQPDESSSFSIQISDEARKFARHAEGYASMSPKQKEITAQLVERVLQTGGGMQSTKTTHIYTKSPIKHQTYDKSIFVGYHISKTVQDTALEVGQKYNWSKSEILNFARKLENI